MERTCSAMVRFDSFDVPRGIVPTQGERVLVAHFVRHIAVQLVVGRRLIRQAHRARRPGRGDREAYRLRSPGERRREAGRLSSPRSTRRGLPRDRSSRGRGIRSRACARRGAGPLPRARQTPSFIVTERGWAPPMPPSPPVATSFPFRLPPNALARAGAEGLVGALQNPLGPDVDPASRRHLPEHGEAQRLEPSELLPRRPVRDEKRVRDEDPRRVRVRLRDSDGPARLHQERFVRFELDGGTSGFVRSPARCGRPFPCRRRPRGPRAFPRPRDRGCSRSSGRRLPAASPCTKEKRLAERESSSPRPSSLNLPRNVLYGRENRPGHDQLARGGDVRVAHAIALVRRHSFPETGMHRLE